MVAEGVDGGGLKVARGAAGGVELAEQRYGLLAHRRFDQGGLAQLLGAQCLFDPLGFGVDAAHASGLGQQAAQLGEGQAGADGRGGRSCQDRAGGRGGVLVGGGEGGEEARVVLAQVGAQLVAGLGAVPDGVLLCAGDDADGFGEFGVRGQHAVLVAVGSQDPGQRHRVEVVGLLAADRAAFAVAGRGHRVDRVDGAAGGPQVRHQQAAAGLDRHRDRVVRCVSVLGQQGDQLCESGRVIADPGFGQQRAVGVDKGDVVVVTRPVDAAEDLHGQIRPFTRTTAGRCSGGFPPRWNRTAH